MTPDPRQRLIDTLAAYLDAHIADRGTRHKLAPDVVDKVIDLVEWLLAKPQQEAAPMDVADIVQTLGMAIEHGSQDAQALAAYRNLGHFIICRTNAIAHRQGGNVDRALIEEKDAETFYKRLPEQWRW